MILVGLMGGIGHGKTTLATYLSEFTRTHHHWEASDIVIEVANALRHEKPDHPYPENTAAINSWLTDLADIVSTCTHTPADFTQLALTKDRLHNHPENYQKLFEYLNIMKANPHLQTQDITPDNKREFRALLQWLGGYLVKTVNEGIWFDEIVRRVHQSARQGLELATVGGVRFPADAERIRSAGGFILEVRRPGVQEVDAQDLTERERYSIGSDSIVNNNGSLAQLKKCTEQVFEDLRERNLRPMYAANPRDRT